MRPWTEPSKTSLPTRMRRPPNKAGVILVLDREVGAILFGKSGDHALAGCLVHFHGALNGHLTAAPDRDG